MNFVVLLIFICRIFVANANSIQAWADESRLLHHLTKHYEQKVRPVRNASNAVKVTVGLSLSSITELDMRHKILTTRALLHLNWQDELISWDPSDYNDLRSLVVPSTALWLPDISLHNEASHHSRTQIGWSVSKVRLLHTGYVSSMLEIELNSRCRVHTRFFPFDQQRCPLIFGSWAYDESQIELTTQQKSDGVKSFEASGELTLSKIEHNISLKELPCCTEPFYTVTFHLWLQRRPLYTICTTIVPAFLTSILLLAVFLLSPDSNERITLAVVLVFCLQFTMLLLWQKLQICEEVPLLAMYLGILLIVAVLTILTSIWVVNMHKRWHNLEMSHCLRVVLDKLCTMFSVDAENCPENQENSALLTDGGGASKATKGRTDKKRDWMRLALVIDRILFWLFAVVVFLTTALLLIVLPLVLHR